MREQAYSLVEVVVAAAIAAIGVAAGAAIASTLVVQQELSAGAVRASNLQEQAVMLYRLGITNPQDLYNILPEVCTASAAPGANGFGLTFGSPVAASANVSVAGGGQAPVNYQAISCTVVFGSPIAGSSEVTYLSNTLSFIRPVIRVEP